MNDNDTRFPEHTLSRRPNAMSRVMEILRPFLALLVVTVMFCVADVIVNKEKAQFSSDRSLRTVAAQTATVAVAALGMTVIIIAGGIDLSVGTSIALCATVLAWSLKEDVAMLLVNGDSVSSATVKLKRAEELLLNFQREADKKNVSVPVDGSNTNSAVVQSRPKTPDEILADARRVEGSKKTVEFRQRRLEVTKKLAPRWTPWTPLVALLTTIGCGCVCGWVNGALVSYLGLVPFIVTLGTMQVYLGLAKKVANETTVRPDTLTQVPAWFGDLLSVRPQALWFGGPIGVWFTLLLALLLSGVLRYTVFGRYVFALGSNEATARLCGINVRWNKIAVYTLSGLFVGIAGLFQFSRLTVGNPTSGSGLELKVIASVVIGGGSLNGGRGTVLGTLTGALIMSVITSGCTALGLTNPIQDMILGIIIVAAVTIDQMRQRRQASA